jgi:hypothetical protein
MSFEYESSIGTFVIYNRKLDNNPEIELLGDNWVGNGFWHFGWKDGDQCRVGYESEADALDSMDRYIWAIVEGMDWKP